ncbi:MAG: hypothetical protein A2722_02430 [Candidatus Doudnabacteria bacterium RIFCSPHIGHO2_01_FULL_50_11]|uniref:Uncharacterized protein n=1 Tax=Candidatus Doudnabacteria bacterium RIFCSPHIGHO2_01_FULL_50_11 TaxID=1817828 RepID=A0A1F5PFQ9_9BACT|nr:MAG: hypothetical protein A2722_02430 [Candidatus Doudnabacteria bacterium RIFCSPHIGHO2_01_FULL_50_11]HLC44415.1 hypothetical protein [Patescibacteria group bacterium]
MASKSEYKELIDEIIKKQIAVLGPDIAIWRARQIEGLKVDDKGKTIDISEPENEALQKLINTYIELSGEIVRNILNPVLAKYPTINVKIK